MIQINLNGNLISSNSKEAYFLEKTKKIGEKQEEKIIYSIPESLYLLKKNRAEIKIRDKKIDFEKALEHFSKKDKNCFNKFLVYKSLREKGYIPKAGLKFGADFRIYDKNEKHSKWILLIKNNNEKINLQEFSSKNRVAHSTKKKILLAIIDSEKEILFYEINWIKI